MTVKIKTVAPPAPPAVLNLEVVFMPPSVLKPYYRNQKKHTKSQITLLAKAMKAAGFDQPVVVDKDLVIIKGHGRRLAALELKLKMVPVVVRADLSPDQVMAARIADNRAHTLSEVDVQAEQAEIAKLAGAPGADVFFGLLQLGKGDGQQPDKNKGPKSKAAAQIAGNLETCPKCGNTFMEVKK